MFSFSKPKNTLLHIIRRVLFMAAATEASEETPFPAARFKQPPKARRGEQQTRALYLIDLIGSSAFKAGEHRAAFLAGRHRNRRGGSAMHRCFFGRNRCQLFTQQSHGWEEKVLEDVTQQRTSSSLAIRPSYYKTAPRIFFGQKKGLNY